MQGYECVTGYDDAMLYSSSSDRSTLLILAKMKHHFCGSRAILEGDVRTLEREELDPCGLKWPLLHRNVVHVSKLVMPVRGGWERSQTTDGFVA